MTTTATPSTSPSTARRVVGGLVIGAVAISLPAAAVGLRASDRGSPPGQAERHGYVTGSADADAVWSGPAEQGSSAVRYSARSDRTITCDSTCVVMLADSDGDGYSDGYEIFAGTDPLDPASRPAQTVTQKLIDEGKLTRLRVTVDGPDFLTAMPGPLYQVDLTATPNGAPAVDNHLVGPNGQPIVKNHYGVDAGSTGVDLRALAAASRKDPSSIGSTPGHASPAVPKDKPEINDKHSHSPYADEEGGEADPPAPDPEPSGGDTRGGSEPVAKDLPHMCNVGDPCGKGDIPPPGPKTPEQPKESGTGIVHAIKCFFSPKDCTSQMEDPESGGSTPAVDTSKPPTKVIITPADPVRDGQPPVEVPAGGPQNPHNDPTVVNPNPDAVPDAVPSGTPPKPSIAPVDPPKPGEAPGGQLPGNGPEPAHTVRTR